MRQEDLAHYVNHRGGRLSGEETFKILKPVMEALAQVHRSELVHRDIAPDNIMLHPRGGAKLLDFGAARMVENADVDKGLDRSTEAIVKHGFAPMEQYQTRGNLGPWTDVYAMCATVYYCLTGQIPPEATTRLMGESSFSWANVPGLTDRQRTALERGMAVLPKDRYRSMEELLDGLFGNAPMPMTYTEPVYTAPQPPVYAPQAPAQKKGKLVPILMGVLVAVALLVGGTLLALWVRESGILQGSAAPAATEAPLWVEAPVATESPVAETEAPGVYEAYYIGIIGLYGRNESLGELLAKRLAETGQDFTLEHMAAGSVPEVTAYAEQMIASGVDAIVFCDAVPSGEAAKRLSDLTASCGVPLILLGSDPSYETGSAEILEADPSVTYVGVDPREVAAMLVGILPKLSPGPDKNANGSISYVYVNGSDQGWGNDVDNAISDVMNACGYAASSLGWVSISDGAVGLRNALDRYGIQIEVIFCGDADAAEMAYRICEEYGIDVWNEIAIIAVGDPERLEDYYATGVLAGYVEYSQEQLVDAVAEVLISALRGEPLADCYSLPCEVHVPGDGATGDKMMAEVTSSELNIRGTPSTTAERVGSYSKGEIVEILQIQTVGGMEWGLTKDGWIVMNYVQIIE